MKNNNTKAGKPQSGSPPWFYFPFDGIEAESITLSGAEVNHILGARRLQEGDQLVLMNGRGELAHCMLQAADKRKKRVTLRVTLVAQVEPPIRSLSLACALPKGDRLSTLLDMASQIGITRFQPLTFERSVSRWSGKLKTRCTRIAIEAAKQSKRAWVPEIGDCLSYSQWLEADTRYSALTLLADQYGCALQSHQTAIESATHITLIVGPEGGLTEQELALAKSNNIASIRLAEPILRIETAAIAGLAAINTVGRPHR